MTRMLFCEISPLTYRLSVLKEKCKRHMIQLFDTKKYAAEMGLDLPQVLYKHKSLIRRTLGQVDPELQNSKAVNLELAAKEISGVMIRPDETFSFWKLVGNCTSKKGYLKGLMIKSGNTAEGIGGGLCQCTNLIHWMVLHTPLQITEHHHHNGVDMFPDFNRQIPFGTGTSIMHNYLDYQFYNPTNNTFQLNLWTCEKYLRGELRCDTPVPRSYHVKEDVSFFIKENAEIFRINEVNRYQYDKATGKMIAKELIIKNRAKVMYDESYISEEEILDGVAL